MGSASAVLHKAPQGPVTSVAAGQVRVADRCHSTALAKQQVHGRAVDRLEGGVVGREGARPDVAGEGSSSDRRGRRVVEGPAIPRRQSKMGKSWREKPLVVRAVLQGKAERDREGVFGETSITPWRCLSCRTCYNAACCFCCCGWCCIATSRRLRYERCRKPNVFAYFQSRSAVLTMRVRPLQCRGRVNVYVATTAFAR